MAECSISIIIPAYNVEKYLKAALDSIKEQTELPDEVILIDDGSTDGTLDVANSFEFPVPYQVVSIENGGQGNARNLGVSLASSEYVYFFDSDDLLANNFVELLKGEIKSHSSPDIIFFSGESFNDSSYEGGRWVRYNRGFSGFFLNPVEFLDKAFECKALFCSPCLYVSRRPLWGPGRLAFPSNFMEDEAIFFSLIFTCSSIAVVDEVIFYRRNRENSTMTMRSSQKHLEGVQNCLDYKFKLLQNEALSQRERWHVRKRLGNNCMTYVRVLQDMEVRALDDHLYRSIYLARSPILALKVCFGILLPKRVMAVIDSLRR